ncbi:MAG: glycosyltransferase [Nitrospirota bacterium]
MGKIRVLHLVKQYKGNYPLRNAMILGLDPKRFEAKACYLSGTPDGKNELDRYGKAIYLGIDNPARSKMHTLRSLVKVIKTERPVVLHCHRHKATVFGVIASMIAGDIKVVSHVHGLGRTRSYKRRFFNFFILKRIEKVIAISESVRQDIIGTNWRLDGEKIAVVMNGIDLKKIDGTTTSKKNARMLLNVPENALVYGTVGRLITTKGQRYLLDAFAKVSITIPHARLVIIGEGPLERELKDKAQMLGISQSVLFLGYRNDVFDLLKALDIFVFPSLAEGLGLALLEAMAARLPIIASRVGGIPEVLDDGKYGVLVAPRDASELADSMITAGLLNEAQRKLAGDAARERVENTFTVEAMCKELVYAYESII